MPSRLFIWTGHPTPGSLSHGLADAYQQAAASEGAEIRRMDVSKMAFEPNLSGGYARRKTLEPDLADWQDALRWCEHTAWFYPQWWGGMPAKMKGVIDRAFLPGFAMRYHDDSPFWDRLLKGRTADVVMTSDAPAWFDRLRYGVPARRQVSRLVLGFSGIHVAKFKQFAPVKTAPPHVIARWLKASGRMGLEAGRR